MRRLHDLAKEKRELGAECSFGEQQEELLEAISEQCSCDHDDDDDRDESNHKHMGGLETY
jgi:hypothetical protein